MSQLLSHFYEIDNFQQKIDFEICRTDDSTGYSSSHQVNSIDHYDLVFEHFSRFRAGLKIFVIFEIFKKSMTQYRNQFCIQLHTWRLGMN